ncbi:MAG: hypothetical protein ABL983_10820, partial [Nitrospira sp.]
PAILQFEIAQRSRHSSYGTTRSSIDEGFTPTSHTGTGAPPVSAWKSQENPASNPHFLSHV